MNCGCSHALSLHLYLYCAQFVLLSGVIIHHHDEVVANVSLFVAAAFVALSVRHQCSDVEDGCKDGVFIEIQGRLDEGTFKKHNAFPVALTLHDVVVPAVGELSVVSVLVEPSEKDLVGVAVLQVDQLSQTRQKGGVAVRAVFV